MAESLLFPMLVKHLLLASLLAACAAESSPAEYPEGLGTPENPIPSEESYALVSRVELGLSIPELDRALAGVRALAENPGRALLARPEGAALLATIPAAVRGNVESYLATEIDKVRIGQKTLRTYTADVARFAKEVLAEVTIDSSLTISPERALHALVDLRFSPADVPVVVPIGGLAVDVLVQRPTAEVAPAGALALGAQKFGLGFGDHAWQAINLASKTLYGDGVSLFTSAVNCTTVAQAVAARCVSGSCVGHATELAALCTRGLAQTIGDLGTQVSAVKLTSFHFTRGTARLVDDNGDGIADQIADGTWDAQTDLGTITATFEAH